MGNKEILPQTNYFSDDVLFYEYIKQIIYGARNTSKKRKAVYAELIKRLENASKKK